MSIVSTTIPNLVNGVSQQPYALRLASQADEQINAYSSVVEGLRKRPPSRHRARILDTPLEQAKIHTINRDSNERYTVVISNGDLRVFDFDGTEKTVTFPEGKAYLASTAPEQDFVTLTVADYTFVLNKTVVATKDTTKVVPARPYEAMIWVKQGAYSTTYSITLGGRTVSHTTHESYSESREETKAIERNVKPNALAKRLYEGLIGSSTSEMTITGDKLDASWTLTLLGAVICVSRTSDFVVSVSDAQADNSIKVAKTTVQRFSDLPAKGMPGFATRVIGTNENAFDDYYVAFEADSGSPTEGVWKEAAKGGEVRAMKASTMPHTLTRQADGTFVFKAATWDDRKVGDLESVPLPSFEGTRLNDIFFHRNRLGILADENVVFSRAGEFFNFYRASALQTLDTDPIDIAVSHVKVSILRHAIPFNQSLLLFSDQTQFTLGETDLLTPRTVSINQTTEFECSLKAKPVGAGQNIYFAVQRGQYTGLREYYVDGDTKTNDAADVTAHCPRYIPQGVVKLVASSNEDVLIALSENDRSSLYVYRYYWSGSEKLQSSWSRWEFDPVDKILSVDFIESDLFIVVSRADGTYLETLSLEPGRVDAPATFTAHLDRRVMSEQTTLSFDPVANRTTVKLPYHRLDGEEYQLIGWYGDAERKPGQLIEWVSGDSQDELIVKGNLTSFIWGRRYSMLYRFSTLMVREDASGGGGVQPVGEGRLQLRRMSLTYNNAGYFRSEVTPKYRDTYRYVFSGRIVGSGQNAVGAIAIEQGVFRFPLSAKNDQVEIVLINDTFLPSAFLSAEWEGFFQIRSKRL